jgi:hypothetical protein
MRDCAVVAPSALIGTLTMVSIPSLNSKLISVYCVPVPDAE